MVSCQQIMKHHFTNQQIVQLLNEVVAAFIVKKQDFFRIRAYQTAASTIENLTLQVEDIWQAGQLTDIAGIGPNLASHFEQLFTTGRVSHFDHIKKSLPEGMFALITLEGVGPKTAYTLAKQFNLTTRKQAINQVKKHAQNNEIAPLPGFGDKKQQQILAAITKFQTTGQKTRLPLYQADMAVSHIMAYLSRCPEISDISPLGSLRRRAETVGDIDIGITTTQPQAVVAHIKQYPGLKKIIVAGEGVVRFYSTTDQQIDCKLETPARWGSLLQHFTGSRDHNIQLRERARRQGKSMSEQGMKINKKWHRYTNEKSFYAAVDLPWIPPELREGRGEIEAANSHKLPTLITREDIKGDLHTHTSFDWVSSHDNGSSTIDDLVARAHELGYHYIGVGDHNPSTSTYSPAKSISLIKKRSYQIDIVRERYQAQGDSLAILKTLEVDIKPDGSLALPAQAADYLDYIVASIHSSFTLSQAKMTDRIVTALSQPKVKVFGHPTARLIQKRQSISADWSAIFALCKLRHIALEINAAPNRMDLPDILVYQAIKQGVKLVINTDAHHADSLGANQYGIDVARRGWAQQQDVINTWPRKKFLNWLTK